jgi:hypothetical protein
MAELSTIDTYTFGRSGGENIINGDIVFIKYNKDITSDTPIKNLNADLNASADFDVESSEITQLVLTSSGIGTITCDNIMYRINNCTITIPISSFDSKITLSEITSVTLNGIWVKRNDVNSNFFQLQSQIGALQNEVAVLTEQLNRANSYASAIMAKNSKYKVGDYYITENSINPSELYGGTWQLMSNQILSCVADESSNCFSDSTIGQEYYSKSYGSGLTITFNMDSLETLPPHYHNTTSSAVGIETDRDSNYW